MLAHGRHSCSLRRSGRSLLELLPYLGVHKHNGAQGKKHGKNRKKPESGHPAKPGTGAGSHGFRGTALIEADRNEAHRAQEKRKQCGRKIRNGQKTNHCASRYDQADHNCTGVFERNSGQGRTRYSDRLEGSLNRLRRLLRADTRRVFFKLRFTAFMTKAGIIGQDGSAGTARLHTFSLGGLGKILRFRKM